MGRQEGEISAREAAPLLGLTSEETVLSYYRAGRIEGREEPRGVMGRKRIWLSQASVEALAQKTPSAGKSR
jgi:hypothetical protein